jgi:hypothetical protein
MKHLTSTELGAFMDGALDERVRARAEAHLAECATCREALAELETQDRGLAAALTHDPGEAYFESFASRVQDRLDAAERARGAAAPSRGGLFGWLGSPRGMAWAGAAAALLVGAGVVFLNADRRDVMRSKELSRRIEQGGDMTLSAPPSEGARPMGDMENQMSPSPAAGTSPGRTSTDELASPTMRKESDQKKANVASPVPPGARFAEPHDATRARQVQPRGEGETRPVPAPGAPAFAPPPPAETPPAATSPPAHDVPAKPRPQPLAKSIEASSPAPPPKQEFKEQGDKLSSSTANETIGALALDRADATGSLCGAVRDQQGRAVSGAQVVLADLAQSASTDHNGRYCLKAPPGTNTLSVMAIGFEAQRRQVEVGPGSSQADVALAPVAVLEGQHARGGMLEVSAPDTFASWPTAARAPAKKAAEESRKAERLTTAPAFDAAAASWEQALKKTQGGAPELEARRALADARYRAWVAAPNAKRKAAASDALGSYMLRAPAGPARDLALQRMTQLGR